MASLWEVAFVDKKVRPWCAIAKYPGKKPFCVGTVVLPDDTRHDCVIDALYEHAYQSLPDGFTIVELVPGALFFVPREEEN